MTVSVSAWKRAGVALTAAAVVTGVAGCQDDGDQGQKKAADAPAKAQGLGDVTKALTAAYEKTSAAKSARFTMTIEMTGAGAQAGSTTMSGVQGWDPAVMDVTMNGGMLGKGAAGGNEKTRMIMRDGVMYVDMGAKPADQMDGKRWMKMDFAAMAKESGDAALQKQMSQSMSSANQDPAQQLALLLESPGIKHVGPEKVAGAQTEHYKGSISFDQAVNDSKAFDGLPEKDRKALIDGVKKAGVKGYDTELWVNEDGYPAKMIVGMKMPQGVVRVTALYSDYGTQATVQAPPAKDTFDFMEMMKQLGQAGAQG
ncbi:hypothetical protein ACIRSU_23405 [Streptomyces sp. NPDC101160]|uniref:hypothetical protein n=1 Tax=Streptomyces sp. NPDC101160 TaxID=3366118 RepID=UPI00380D89D1